MTAPLTQWEDGTIRISGTRVPIDSVLHHFKLGAVPEQIVYMFEGLRLADIYAVIAYYLSHLEAIEEYLRKQDAREEAFLQRLESNPSNCDEQRAFRERLLARWGTLQEERASLLSM